MNFYFPLVTRPASADHLLMGTTRLFETVDGGRTWMTIGAPGGGGWPSCDSCNPIDSIAVAPSDPDTIYVSAGGHILVTRTHGIRWQQHDIAGGTNPHFRSLLVDPTNPLIAYAARDRFGGGHVFRTIDAGQSWTDISGDLPDFPANALVLDGYAVPKSLYAGTDVGVYASTERGGHWTRLGTALPNAQVVELQLHRAQRVLMAATHGRGVWEIRLRP